MSGIQEEVRRTDQPPLALFEIDDVADLLHVSRSLLAKWRMKGRGPRFMKAGRRILYECGEVRRWLEAQERSSTLD